MLTWFNRLIRSKTIIFNVLTVLSLVLVGDDIKEFVSADTIIKIQAAVNIILRFATSTALSEKGE